MMDCEGIGAILQSEKLIKRYLVEDLVSVRVPVGLR